jgi:hypothetical protein
MASYFFRVEHELLRSEVFKTLGGSAIKVYLVIGLYSDFGTDWAYPSLRTIARQAGLSRQTVITAIHELTQLGLLAVSRSKGRSTAYRILRQPDPKQRPSRTHQVDTYPQSGYLSTASLIPCDEPPVTSQNSLPAIGSASLDFLGDLVQISDRTGPTAGPKQDALTIEDTASIPIPGTPFRISAEGRLLVAVDLQQLLTNRGIPHSLAHQIVEQKDAEAVAKVLLNAFYLESQGKLQNGAGYIRAGIEDGYELLPQVAMRLEGRRRELAAQLQVTEARQQDARRRKEKEAEDEAMAYILAQLGPHEVERLVQAAIAGLPEQLVRRNPTLSNPFIRGKVYELASGEPADSD